MHERQDLELLATQISTLHSHVSGLQVWTAPTAALVSLRSICAFDENWPNDPATGWKKNIELREVVSRVWASAVESRNFQQLYDLSIWIIKDWGGIKYINRSTVEAHLNDALTNKLAVPFEGISSKSKVLSFANPIERQIYDARVAACLNVLQTAKPYKKRM